MYRTLILYESKHGFTEGLVENLALILGPAQFSKCEDFRDEYKNFDFFVIGIPVYGQKLYDVITQFIADNASWLREKQVAIFCTCAGDEPGKSLLVPLKSLLGDNVVDLTEINDHWSLEYIIEYALKIKSFQEVLNKKMPEAELKEYIDDFLRTHNTCTLSTGHHHNIRSTPMEYTYRNGYMYFLTEGGRKYANLLLNNQVTIATYDNLVNWSSLMGIQLSGTAEMVEYASDKYLDILRLKKLNPEKILGMRVRMNVFQVKLHKAEYLNARFKQLGYDVRQYLTF